MKPTLQLYASMFVLASSCAETVNIAFISSSETSSYRASPTNVARWAHNSLSDDDDDDDTLPFRGAGVPRPELFPAEIPSLLMKALKHNDVPEADAGLKSMWAFAGGTTRHIFGQNRTEFLESAHETADTLPTSFYGAAMRGKSWAFETDLNRVGGVDGYIATRVMKTVSSDGRVRRWQWELRKERRPPHLDCWFVESIGSSNRKGEFEAD